MSSVAELRQKDGVRAFLREVERRDEELDASTKIHDLAFRGDTDALKTILNRLKEDEDNFDINAPHPTDGRTLLHSAAMGVPSKMIEFLVQKPWFAFVDSRDNRGRTPLLYAAMHGSTRVVTKLIAFGADEHAVDEDGVGSLMHAAQGGHVAAVLFLFHAGVDVHKHANDGRTALHVAAFAGIFVSVKVILPPLASFSRFQKLTTYARSNTRAHTNTQIYM
jgi:ankyrin repeat protein